MNNNVFMIQEIRRIVAHEIHPKTEHKEAFSKTHDYLLEFDESEKKILIERLEGALLNTTKTFQLEFENKSESSVYSLLSKLKDMADTDFVKESKGLAYDLANAHFRTKIPGGFCLIGDGFNKINQYVFFVIKAELQEVFNIRGKKLKLIKDVFLSPAKDFYKIGYFVGNDKLEFMPYMYDDLFSLQKKDLTEYFYGKFLGLTTDKSDKLKSKNFYEEVMNFIGMNITDLDDRWGLERAVRVLYREDTSGLISPRDFSSTYFIGDLKEKFDRQVIKDKFELAFTKDTSLIESRLDLQRTSIPFAEGMTIVGNRAELQRLEIVDNPSSNDIENLVAKINNGQIGKILTLARSAASDVKEIESQ